MPDAENTSLDVLEALCTGVDIESEIGDEVVYDLDAEVSE